MVRRTKEEALETRNRILDAAELIFEKHGVSRTSLQQIAHAAHVTRGAIYWHFKDKAELFEAMMERATMPMEALFQPFEATELDPLAFLEKRLVTMLRITAGSPQIRRAFDIATHKVEYTHDMQSVHQRHLDARNACVIDFEKAMLAGARRARIRLPIPAAAAALGLHALISGLIQDWLLDPEAFDLVSTGRRTFRVYLSGLGFVRPLASGG